MELIYIIIELIADSILAFLFWKKGEKNRLLRKKAKQDKPPPGRDSWNKAFILLILFMGCYFSYRLFLMNKDPKQVFLFKENPDFVYHATSVQNIKELKPHKSTHRKNWVYAAKDPAITFSFIAKSGDFLLGKGTCKKEGLFHIVERIPGALKRVYSIACCFFLVNLVV